jgi:guanylate kinase
MMAGNLIIVSAPSGAGKTTLVGEVLKCDEQSKPSISYTSRAPREGEQNGVHYHFISLEEFEAMIAGGEFLEWAEVHGHLYGTSQKLVDDLRRQGFDVILTIDVQGAEQARRNFSEAVSVFILPPTFEAMVERLNVRGANRADDLQLRLKNARCEIAKCSSFDYIIINDDLDRAVDELASIILAERCRSVRRTSIVEQILKTFDTH